MSNDFFTKTAERRAEAIARLDAQTFAPLIRNHLVQLFRRAHAVDPKLTGVIASQGTAGAFGEYAASYEDEVEPSLLKATHWSADQMTQPDHPETRALLAAVAEYSDTLCSGNADELPYIDDITPADLQTTRAKKAAIHGPRGLRARLNA